MDLVSTMKNGQIEQPAIILSVHMSAPRKAMKSEGKIWVNRPRHRQKHGVGVSSDCDTKGSSLTPFLLLGRAIKISERLLAKHWIVIAYAVSCCLLP